MTDVPQPADLGPVDDSVMPIGASVPQPGSAEHKAREDRTHATAARRPRAYTHPQYDAHLSLWEFLRQSYEGGEEYLRENLWSHPIEPEPHWERRLQRAVSVNHLQVVVDTYAAQLFKRSPSRTLPSAGTLADFWSDPTGTGQDADEWLEESLQFGYDLGVVGAVVDRREPDEAPVNRAAEQASGRRPYAYLVLPQDIIDWSPNGHGHFAWLAIREELPSERSPTQPYEPPGERIRIWYEDRWELYRVEEIEAKRTDAAETEKEERERYKYILEASAPHPCGRVPVEFLYTGRRRGDAPIAESPVKQIAYLVRRLTNHVSLIDEQIFHYVFSLLVLDQYTGEAIPKNRFAPQGYLELSSEAVEKGFKPFYLAPDVGQIEAIRREIEETEMAIRFLSGLGRQNEASRAASSGIALAYQTVDKRALINQLGQTMSAFERGLSRLALLWMEDGDPPDDYAPAPYEVELQPDEIDQELARALKFSGLIAGASLSEAAIENAVQAARARFAASVEPKRLSEILDDLRQRLFDAPAAPEIP